MQLFTCCLLILSLATTVVTGPVRAGRENVLSFITDALEKTRTTEKMIPANITGNRNPLSKPGTDDDSEDMSDAKSAENFANNGFKDAVKDLDSHEILIPAVVEKDKAPSRRNTGADVGGTEGRVVQDRGSRKQSGPPRQLQASRERTDFHSDEVMLATHGVGNLKGEQRKVGRGDELNGMLGHEGSRELQDRDSLEDNNGRIVPLGTRDTDYDETREYFSSETYPLARPEHAAPSSLFVPARSQAS